MERFQIQATQNLPEHNRILKAVLAFFYKYPGVVGCFLGGSAATDRMDWDSDLDMGLLIQNSKKREEIWAKRWDWEIVSWFHRFDADHIKPYFVIYCVEPNIRVDINLYVEKDLPPIEGAPYTIVWDRDGSLGSWLDVLSQQEKPLPNWDSAVHEDERFWAWSLYVHSHLHRGEYYHIAAEFFALRGIVENWSARLAGYPRFSSRDLENKPFASHLLDSDLFPKPELRSLKQAMLKCIDLQLSLREEIEQKIGVQWKTSDAAIEKITDLIKSL